MATAYDLRAKDVMTPYPNIKSVQKSDRLSAAVGVMTNEGIHSVVVLDGTKYFGVFGHQQLVRLQNIPPTQAKVEHFVFRPTKISPDSSLVEVADAMFRNNCRILPVMQKDRLLGIVSEWDVTTALVKTGELTGRVVGDFMTPNPYCVKERDEIATALGMMRDFRVSRLPVLDKAGKVSGVLESFDAIRRIVAKETQESRLYYYGYRAGTGVTEQLPVYKVAVRELMNNRPVIAKPDDDISEKIGQMAKMGETTLVVTNERQEPVGVVAPRDFVEWVASLKKPTGLYMQISGWDPALVGDFAEAQVNRLIEDTAKKVASIVDIRNFAVHFKTFHEAHDRLRYSFRARLLTDYGLFVAAEHGYDVVAVANKLFGRIEREVIEFEKRHRDLSRQKARRSKFGRKGRA